MTNILFSQAAQLFGLEVNLKKTEVLHQPASWEDYLPPHINIGKTKLKSVHQFTYLSCAITTDAKVDKAIDNRLAKVNSAFCRLYKRVWNNKHLKKGTKVNVYRAVALITLLYGSESWVAYRHHLRLLKRFHQHCLRTIFNIHWSDYVTKIEVLELADITSIAAMLLKSQLRWAGCVSTMEDHHLSKIVIYGELSSGCEDRGGRKKRYKGSLKKSLDDCNINHGQWLLLAANRQSFLHTIHQAVGEVSLISDSFIRELR